MKINIYNLLTNIITEYNMNTVNSYYCERVSSLNLNAYNLITINN